MRILHIYKDYYPVLGGIENHVRLLAEAQAARGHEVTVLVTARGGRGEVVHAGGVRVIKAARLATVASTPLSLALVLALRGQRPDIAHVHVPYPVGETANWLLGRGRRAVLTYHSDVVRQRGWLRLYAPVLGRVLAAADAILVTSPQYLRSSPFLQPVARKCRVVPLGIDTAAYASADPARVAALRERFGTPLLLFAGRLRYYKGLQYLLQALTQVDDVRLVVVGAGPMAREWQALAGELGVQSRVTFCGEVADEDLPAYYHAADIFVLPACERAEAFGLVQVEAMAAGRPVVSTELGTGTSFVNQDGVTGLVVPPRDAHALAVACRRLLNDVNLRARLGAAAQERARSLFDAQAMVQQVEEVYRSLLAADGGSLQPHA
ncbi:MAG: glycosyltransferase [Anaerolineae bacterium]